MTSLEDLTYLWDGSQPGWVLVNVGDDRFSIYNKLTRMVLLIEDDKLFGLAVRRMQERGAEVYDPAGSAKR